MNMQNLQSMLAELGQYSQVGKHELTLSKATQADKFITQHFGKDHYGFKSRVDVFRAISHIAKGQDFHRLGKGTESK